MNVMLYVVLGSPVKTNSTRLAVMNKKKPIYLPLTAIVPSTPLPITTLTESLSTADTPTMNVETPAPAPAPAPVMNTGKAMYEIFELQRSKLQPLVHTPQSIAVSSGVSSPINGPMTASASASGKSKNNGGVSTRQLNSTAGIVELGIQQQRGSDGVANNRFVMMIMILMMIFNFIIIIIFS